MLAQRFALLDGATIAVELSQNGVRTTLRGTGAYGRDAELGSVLTIKVKEAWGDFDFVLREDEFDGTITSGAAQGCEYSICLSADCVFCN
jgi:hypothetical protein